MNNLCCLVNPISSALSWMRLEETSRGRGSGLPPHLKGLNQVTRDRSSEEEGRCDRALGMLTPPYLQRVEPNDQTLVSPEGTTDTDGHCTAVHVLI